MADAPSAQAPPAPTDQNILNTPTLLMGMSGSGKSALLATLMEWAWEHYRAISFYYLFDGGGFPTQVQALINRGICRLWRVGTRSEEPPASIHRAFQGWWPERINPRTGETTSAVRLVAPVTAVYTMLCPNGHVVRTSSARRALTTAPCPTCQMLVNETNMRVTEAVARTKGFPEKRLCLYDGLTAAQDWFMEDIAKRNLGGEKGALADFTSDGMLVATASRAKIGSAQSRAAEWIKACAHIPDLVVPAVVTALTQEGSEEGGLTVVGPSMAGNAKTPVAPQWFGNTLEASALDRDGKKWFRLYFQQFMDERGRRHLCRVGAYPGAFEPYWEESKEEGAAPFRVFNLGLFHQRLTDARMSTEAAYLLRYPDAPGIAGEESTYGEPVGGGEPAHVPSAQGASGQRPAPPPPPPPPARQTRASSQPPPAAATVAGTSGVARPLPPPRPVAPSPVVQPAQPVVGSGGVSAPKPAPPQPTPAPPARPAPSHASAAGSGLPPRTIGPPKPPVAGPAAPAGRKPV